MASIPVSLTDNLDQPHEGDSNGQFIRVIVADTQAIFRAGLRKIFALEDDIRVVGQSETLAQTLAAAKKFSADVLILEAALTPNPLEAVADLLRQCPQMKMVVVTHEPNEELTLDLFRRGAHGIVSREVEPEILGGMLAESSARRALARPARYELGAERVPNSVHPTHGQPSQSPIDTERIADRFLRDARHEE